MVSLGGRGYRVRLFQKRYGGEFFRAIWLPGATRQDTASLHTHDRDEAYALGSRFVSELLRSETEIEEQDDVPAFRQVMSESSETVTRNKQPVVARDATSVVPLGELCRRYQAECQRFLNNGTTSKLATALAAKLFVSVFGTDRDVQTLSPDDLLRYAAKRRAGRIPYTTDTGKDRLTGPTRQRSVHADLGFLRTMLRWAQTVLTEDGTPWLIRNPLENMRFEREKNPHRPVTSKTRYRETRHIARRLAAEAADNQERLTWIRLELAVFVAYHTARRRSAIAGLRWEDFNMAASKIVWRKEHDKKKVEWTTPVPPSFMRGIRLFQQRLGAPRKGVVFPCDTDQTKSVEPDRLSKWLKKAEEQGGLAKLKGGLWHPYRRRWASDRLHLPLKAVADAGGWKDVMTLVKCYQQTDDATLLAVMRARAA